MLKLTFLSIRVPKITKLFIVLVVGMYFYNCSSDKLSENNNNLIEINLNEERILKELPMSSFCSEFKLIFLEVNGQSLIGDISAIYIKGNNIYVLDSRISKSLFVFDLEGNFIRKIGQTGNGPGEYIRPSCFTINKNDSSIYIVDNSQKKIIKYSSSGNFIKDIQCENNVVSIVCQDNNIYLKHQPFFEKNKYLISKINESGKIKNTYLPFPQNSKGYLGGLLTYGYSFVSLVDAHKFIKPFGDNVYEIRNNNITSFISINSSNCVNEKDVKRFIDLEKQNLHGYDYIKETDKIFSNKFRGIDSYSETQDIFYINSIYNKVTLNIVFDFKNRNVVLFNKKVDDLTYFTYSLPYINSNNEYLISFIGGRSLKEFMQNIKTGLVNLTQEEQDHIFKLGNENNPIIVLYKTKTLDKHGDK